MEFGVCAIVEGMSPRASRSAIPKPPKSPADTRRILAMLSMQHPNADTELNFRNPYELLVATILSAQCTDDGGTDQAAMACDIDALLQIVLHLILCA